jgi:diguanylate cyclase (GGDEF)-like protein/PAS domain S-box-containing protein
VLSLLHPLDIGLASEAVAHTVSGGDDWGFLVLRVRHDSGRWLELEAMGSRLVVDGLPAGLVITCRPVSRRDVSANATHDLRDRYEQAFELAPIGMALIGLDGRLMRVNQMLTEMVGRPRQELTGRILFELAHPDDRDAAIAHALAVLSTIEPSSHELRFVKPDGTIAWARISASVIRDAAGDPVQGLVHAEDITVERAARDALVRAAMRDPLTGLLNRGGFAARFEATPSDDDGDRILMLIDLDGFKAVNDNHGHRAGDEVLCAVADRLRGCLREDSLIARIGGDEFVVYLPAVHDAATAMQLGDRVRDALARPHDLGPATVRVAGSVGVALLHGAVELSDALAAADVASYTAKRAGGDSVHLSWRTALVTTPASAEPVLATAAAAEDADTSDALLAR